MAPSSSCWQIRVTPRETLGSCRLGVAIRKWSLRNRGVSMVRSVRAGSERVLSVPEDVAGEELPGAGDVQDVDVLLGPGDRGERLGQADDALGGLVEDGVA